MYRIVRKEALKPTVILYEIDAPMVAKKAEPGQFIILRVDENGERIPITIHDYDREKGTVTIIVQTVGATTEKLSHKQQGECLHDFVGPLARGEGGRGAERRSGGERPRAADEAHLADPEGLHADHHLHAQPHFPRLHLQRAAAHDQRQLLAPHLRSLLSHPQSPRAAGATRSAGGERAEGGGAGGDARDIGSAAAHQGGDREEDDDAHEKPARERGDHHVVQHSDGE